VTAHRTDAVSAGDTDLYLQTSAGATLNTIATFTSKGAASFRNSTDTSTAFQIQKADGSSAFTVDDTANSSNLVTNGNFEVNANGWSPRTGCTTLAQTNAQSIFGTGSGSCVTTTTAGAGFNYNLTLSATTQYSLSFYVKGSAGFSTLDFGYAPDGSTETTFLS